jgi:hypothetical protein
MITELRTYKLKKGTSKTFEKIFTEQSLPMLKRWKLNVVDFGFSLIDQESFYLIRSYESIEQRKQSQDAFYGSEQWINGPDKPLMNCIETYNTAIVEGTKLSIIKIE